jgi:hypothetical protein
MRLIIIYQKGSEMESEPLIHLSKSETAIALNKKFPTYHEYLGAYHYYFNVLSMLPQI